MPLVDLSSLELPDEPSETVSPSSTSPVADTDIPTSHPIIDPHLAAPLGDPLPPVDPLPVALPPPPALPPVRQHCLNEVERLFDYFEHHPLRDDHGGAAPARIKGEIADAGLEQALQASLTFLAMELGSPSDTMDDMAVLAATTSDHDVSIAPSSLHEALQGPNATEWTEAIR